MSEIKEYWLQMEQSYRTFLLALNKFLAADKSERVELLQNGYPTAPNLAVAILRDHTPVEELKPFLPFLVLHASSVHRFLFSFRQIILRIPREWLRAHIEHAAEPVLAKGDDEDFRRILELYLLIDRDITFRLAKRAQSSSDPEIREVGSEFLEELAGNHPAPNG